MFLLWNAFTRRVVQIPFGGPANFNLWGERAHPSIYR